MLVKSNKKNMTFSGISKKGEGDWNDLILLYM